MTTVIKADKVREFLVEFFKTTPGLITGLFASAPKGRTVLAQACVPHNWKRQLLTGPGHAGSRLQAEKYIVWKQGGHYPRGPHEHSPQYLPAEQVAFEHVFRLTGEEPGTALSFLVLQTVTGELRVGESIEG